ncbi:MAG TPA: hypothetical protein VH165_11095, partial [Kofleriaceae bacterium]|nr:hypothetical protein [Kofleriaceae bacterium]
RIGDLAPLQNFGRPEAIEDECVHGATMPRTAAQGNAVLERPEGRPCYHAECGYSIIAGTRYNN